MEDGPQSSTTTTYRESYRKSTIESRANLPLGGQLSIADVRIERNLTDRDVFKDEPVSPKIVFELRADAWLSTYARDFMLPLLMARKVGQRPQSSLQKEVPRTGCTTAMDILAARTKNGNFRYFNIFLVRLL